MTKLQWQDIKVGQTYVSAANPASTRLVLKRTYQDWLNRFVISYHTARGREGECTDENFCRWANSKSGT